MPLYCEIHKYYFTTRSQRQRLITKKIKSDSSKLYHYSLIHITNMWQMWQMFAVMYFLFGVSLCGLAVVVTIVVLRLNLHAESKPLVAMPAWVSL